MKNALPEIEDAATLLGDLRRKPASKIKVNKRNRTLTLNHAYPYEVDLDRIRSERDLLAWALHLCEKDWMDTVRLHEFIGAVAKEKGFNLHGL